LRRFPTNSPAQGASGQKSILERNGFRLRHRVFISVFFS
jgi:hypothetical protein